MKTGRRKFLVNMAATVATMSSARPSAAGKLRKIRLRIASNSAPTALADFVRQTGLQVLFDFDAVRDCTTREVIGDLGPEEALALMFEGSGLVFEFINDRTIAVRPRPLKPLPEVHTARESPDPGR